MSMEEYKSALKAGQKDYRAHVARGQNPYLPVLDDILVNVEIVATEPLGLVNMPSESIVGTKTSGRHTAFAPNFMPLLDEDTEFATKWSVLCNAHLDEGIRNPVTAYEFLNQFYIEEGNKRVSVLKHFDSASIPGTVTRLIPARNDSLENRIYYEFLDFYKLSKVNIVQFSRLGSYAKLQKLVCKASGEEWTDDDRKNFNALHTKFRKQFRALGGARLPLTVGDALLVYLSVYRYTDACDATPAQIKANLSKMWDEITVLTKDQAVEVVLEPQTEAASPLAKPLSGLSKLNIFTRPSELRVTFIHEYSEAASAWVRAHEKGRDALANTFGDRVILSSRENVDPGVDAEQVLEEVAHDGADVVFTTSVRMHTACLKVAAQHPKTKFLNCSLNAPHPLVRTYYPRTYEATYILGMLAGILSPTNVVGYVAPNPVYGIPAAVNAYAQGLRSVRPEGRVLLRWACLPDPEHPPQLLRPGGRHPLLRPGQPGGPRFPPGLRPVPAAAQRGHPPAGPARVALGRVLHRDHPLDPERQLGRRRHRQGHQLLVGHEERRRRHPLQPRAARRVAAAAGPDGDPAARRAADHLPRPGIRPKAPAAQPPKGGVHPQRADDDGLAGRVRGGQPAQLRPAGRQDPGPGRDLRPGRHQGRAGPAGQTHPQVRGGLLLPGPAGGACGQEGGRPGKLQGKANGKEESKQNGA